MQQQQVVLVRFYVVVAVDVVDVEGDLSSLIIEMGCWHLERPLQRQLLDYEHRNLVVVVVVVAVGSLLMSLMTGTIELVMMMMMAGILMMVWFPLNVGCW
jgi:hypothetical protein